MAEGESGPSWGAPIEVAEGPFKGWLSWYGRERSDPFETLIGPLCFKYEADGSVRCAFEPRTEHLNGGGYIHGGALMAFADFALFCIANNVLNGPAVTLTCNNEFISAGKKGSWVEATGEVLKETRSVIFIRGLISQEGNPVLSFSATLKKLRV